MTAFEYNHESLLFWLTIASVVGFILSIIMIPWLVTRIPSDYFSHAKRQKHTENKQSQILRLIFILIKNIIGVILIIGGIIMLFLPGQGVLTIIVGLFIMDFPYKYRLETWIVKHPTILKSINKLRAKKKQRPLEI